jgi:hypothetical protein
MKSLREITLAHEVGKLREAESATWAEYEAAYHVAGAYGEALRGLDAIRAELHTVTDPDRRAVLRQAREWAGAFTPDVLRKLRDCRTFAGRERIRADAALRERIRGTLAQVEIAERREADAAKREADAQLDREYKRAVIRKVGSDERRADPGSERRTYLPTRRLTPSAAALLAIAIGCPKLDRRNRRPPSHWEVFLAAWREGMNDYDMERRFHWPRRTAAMRLRAIETTYLNGEKVSNMLFDPVVFKGVQEQMRAGRESGARYVRPESMLDNTRATDAEGNMWESDDAT